MVCWDRDSELAYKARVSLTDDSVISWVAEPDEQPNMTVDEWLEAQTMLCSTRTSSPRWPAAASPISSPS